MLGIIEDRSETFAFDFTTYYQKEMGDGLQKFWISFRDLREPGFLSKIKRLTNELEASFAVDNYRRRVNLDPGYVTAAKLVLASTKDFAHRLSIGRQIYGDVQLRFIRGEFRPSEWTYPDYQTEMGLQFFARVRERFNTQEKVACKTE